MLYLWLECEFHRCSEGLECFVGARSTKCLEWFSVKCEVRCRSCGVFEKGEECLGLEGLVNVEC